MTATQLDNCEVVNAMLENANPSTRVMIMRSFLAQSGARSPTVAMMMLQREYQPRKSASQRSSTANSLSAKASTPIAGRGRSPPLAAKRPRGCLAKIVTQTSTTARRN